MVSGWSLFSLGGFKFVGIWQDFSYTGQMLNSKRFLHFFKFSHEATLNFSLFIFEVLLKPLVILSVYHSPTVFNAFFRSKSYSLKGYLNLVIFLQILKSYILCYKI